MVSTRSRYYRSPSPDYRKVFPPQTLGQGRIVRRLLSLFRRWIPTVGFKSGGSARLTTWRTIFVMSCKKGSRDGLAAFPCTIGYSDSKHGGKRSVSGHCHSMTGMCLSCYHSIWSWRPSKHTGGGLKCMRRSCS
jgi:hypothetical protein